MDKHKAWLKNVFTGAICIDIEEAYNNVHPKILIEDLIEEGIHHQTMKFIANFIHKRTLHLYLGQNYPET